MGDVTLDPEVTARIGELVAARDRLDERIADILYGVAVQAGIDPARIAGVDDKGSVTMREEPAE